MNTTAADIAAAFRRDLPGIGRNRLHKLLYLAQGHHLAWFGKPLFVDPVSAWDNGPVVAALWHHEQHHGPSAAGYGNLSNGELNTVGYVASRYGNLSRVDLETLTRNQPPYLRANEGRRPGEATRIDPDVMAAWFRTVDVDDDEPPVDTESLKAFLARAAENIDKPAKVDDVDEILAKYGRRTVEQPAEQPAETG